MIEGGLVRHEVQIAAPRDAVFDLFTDPDLLVRWIGIGAELDPRPGGLFRFEVATGEFCRGRYLEVERPHRIVFTWGWEGSAVPVFPESTVVEVELHEAEGGTRLVLVHRGLEGEMLGLHDQGWTAYLGRLQAVCEGRDPGPDPATRSPEEALDELKRGEGP